MITQHQFLPIVSAALIVFLCSSCGSDTSQELVGEVTKVAKVTEKSNASIMVNPVSIREFISPPTLSLLESPSLNANNLVSFGFRSTKAGTISYSGNCFGSTKNAINGDHHILFCDNGGRKL